MNIKSIAKNVIQKNSKEIIYKCQKFQVISFDIFDTLLIRDVEKPEQIFDLIENSFDCVHKIKSNFKKKRIKAEQLAREERKGKEIAFDDIYENLNGFNGAQKKELQKLELEIENNLLHVNKDIKPVYDYCKHANKIIVITSDMYLPQDFLENVLRKNGYDYWDDFFLSNSRNKTKVDGELFNELKIKFKQEKILHIGDMLQSDYLNPKKKNIGSVLVNSNFNNTKYYNKTYCLNMEKKEAHDYNLLYGFLNKHLNKNNSIYFNFGYEVIGPILYGFSVWLEKKRKEDGLEKLFFLSREGLLLQKAYSYINSNIAQKSEYIRVSRYATCIPLLDKISNLEQLRKTVYCPKAGSIKDLLLSCDFSVSQIESICTQMGIYSEKVVLELDSKEENELFTLIKPILDLKAKEQYSLICGYLKQVGFQGECGIVDVGWKGTIHNNLEKICPQNIIHGYYIGLRRDSAAVHNSSILRNGFLFGNDNKVTEIQRRLSSTLSVFENFFLSIEGTTVAYKFDENKYAAVMLSSEQCDESAENIKEIQNAALQFVKEFSKSIISANINITPDIAFSAYDKFAVTPSNETISFLKCFKCFNTTKYSLVSEHNLIYYTFHFKQLYRDFMNNTCKVVFMKSLFHIPLPYYKIWKLMHKIESNPINPID
mgnify:CR=1 FL=1